MKELFKDMMENSQVSAAAIGVSGISFVGCSFSVLLRFFLQTCTDIDWTVGLKWEKKYQSYQGTVDVI